MQPNHLFKQTVDLLCPFMEDSDNRRALVRKALHGCKVLEQIEWSGNAQAFTVHLVDCLLRFGGCSQELAIILVLEEAKQQSGTNKQKVFQDLIDHHKNQRLPYIPQPKSILIYTFIIIGMVVSLLILYSVFVALYNQLPNTPTLTPSQSDVKENVTVTVDQPKEIIETQITNSLCEAIAFDITPSLSEPAGTILSLYGEGKCRGDAMPRATRFTIDGEGFGEDATTRVQAETWAVIEGKHNLCFEITVGPWEVAGKACKEVIGE